MGLRSATLRLVAAAARAEERGQRGERRLRLRPPGWGVARLGGDGRPGRGPGGVRAEEALGGAGAASTESAAPPGHRVGWGASSSGVGGPPWASSEPRAWVQPPAGSSAVPLTSPPFPSSCQAPGGPSGQQARRCLSVRGALCAHYRSVETALLRLKATLFYLPRRLSPVTVGIGALARNVALPFARMELQNHFFSLVTCCSLSFQGRSEASQGQRTSVEASGYCTGWIDVPSSSACSD
ncbi:uncharacterized protein LOC141572500 [Rhinolophus sinicus]|uniref:uncharacterized protein LOC141572500 n=1 Tax=Rhinolophus sinicus TaxID=89399 RepID=UPI003D7BD04B